MKTQIITLAAHDDLISIRDRMSWAKAPRILLVLPPREQVALQPLDLRILQKHARELGAEIGLVARGGRIRRDALAFGIPVFGSSIEAQRQPWGLSGRRGGRRTGLTREKLIRLRALQGKAGPGAAQWTSSSIVRLASFGLAVFSVLAIASLFVPRATVVLTPQSQEQSLTLTVDVRTGEGAALVQGSLPAHSTETQVTGSQTTPVKTRSQVAMIKSTGVARFQNLAAVPLFVPAGTVVYSLKPALVRFVTLEDIQMDGGTNNIVDVPIEAMEAGTNANLPAEAIEGTEGSLSASVSVTNPESISGGTAAEQSVPSEGDREQLRSTLEQALRAQAQAKIEAALQEGDLLLPGSPALHSIELEDFDPPAGQAASVLKLTLEATYQALYVRGADLRALGGIALDAQTPSEYAPRDGTLRLQVNQIAAIVSGQSTQLQLDLDRTVGRRIDTMRANQLVRGASPAKARQLLLDSLPLAAAPEIRMTPTWWPWMPLIPFRIEMIVQ